jgi:chromosome segregation ATPase
MTTLSFRAMHGDAKVQPLEAEHRRLINIAAARARAFARNQLRAEIAAEREAMQREMDALRDKLQAQAEHLQKQMAELHRALTDARQEAQLLREWWQAHGERRRTKAELLTFLR